MQGLIVDEIIGKRERQIRALSKGLETLGILELLIKHPTQMEQLLVYNERPLTADVIRDTMSFVANNAAEQQAIEWFFLYLKERDVTPGK